MNDIHMNCYSTINEACSKRAHEKLGLDWKKTQKCFKDSFSDSGNKGSPSTTNKLIDQEIGYW